MSTRNIDLETRWSKYVELDKISFGKGFSYDAEINLQDSSGNTILMYATYGCSESGFRRYRQYCDKYQQNNTYIDDACTDCCSNICVCEVSSVYKDDKDLEIEHVVKMLIDAGANLDLQNHEGETALMIAAQYLRYSTVVKLLVEAGANVNLQNENGYTVLMYVVNNFDDCSFVEMLIDAGANVNLQRFDGQTAIMLGTSHFYHFQDQEVILNTMLQAGADLNITDLEGNTALIHAARHSKSDNIVKMLIDFIIKNNIDVNAYVNLQNNDGYTALSLSAWCSKIFSTENILKILINAGSSVNITNAAEDYLTSLTQVLNCDYSTENTVKILIEAGSEISLDDLFKSSECKIQILNLLIHYL